MKKSIRNGTMLAMITGLFALNGNTAQAQEGLYVGVKGMPQVSFLLNQDDSDAGDVEYESTYRSAFGVGVGYKFSESSGVAVNLIYSSEGQKFNVSGNHIIPTEQGGNSEPFYDLTYLKIPLMFTFNTDPSSTVYFTGRIGPQIGLLTSNTLDNWDGDELTTSAVNVDDRYSSTVISGTLSLLATIHLADQLLLDAGFRGDYGFTNAEDEDWDFYRDDRASTHPVTGALEIGLRYSLGG